MEHISQEIFKKENRLKLFGHEDAGKEKNDRLQSYYYKTQQYEDILSDINLQIIVGEKGTGKSALLKIAYIESVSNKITPVWIRLDDLSELYHTILTSSDLYELKSIWKKSISKLVAMKLAAEIHCTAGEDYERALSWAYSYGYASRDFISDLFNRLKPIHEKYISSITTYEDGGERGVFERMMKNNTVRIFMDDFDLNWKGNSNDILKIKSLLLALSDLCSDIDGLSVRIALRTDVYEMIRNEEFSDKFESSIIKCQWNNNEIISVLCKRICAYFKLDSTSFDNASSTKNNYIQYLNYVFEERFSHYTRCWNDAPIYRVIFSLIRRKPRDMVKLCLSVSEQAYSQKLNKINDTCFLNILESYSQERLKDLVNEYRNQLPSIQSLLIKMAPTKEEAKNKSSQRYVYTTDQLINKIKNIQSNLNIKIYQAEFQQLMPARPLEIAHFLYKIGFITGRSQSSSSVKISRVYYNESPYLLMPTTSDGGYAWEIHPAYRGALAMSNNDSWETTLDVDDEDYTLIESIQQLT